MQFHGLGFWVLGLWFQEHLANLVLDRVKGIWVNVHGRGSGSFKHAVQLIRGGVVEKESSGADAHFLLNPGHRDLALDRVRGRGKWGGG